MTERWEGSPGVVRLPGGAFVRGRRLGGAPTPADFALVLGEGPAPVWSFRRIVWPDFRLPGDTGDALDALHEVRTRAQAGERVEVSCRGGVGRTGTALAALAVLDGMSASDAVHWVRATYHRRAVETPWQRRWLRHVH
ncbi:protein-tyrosine phosphatase family protein [Blastococcus litoris]|uniref:protein-tyrosine phosphatase family protein n=1 Tax=Blastococcus litoris TaxID=2171622 RepID=UPI000E30A5F1|nr:protein-tyrosine phosphatase family protein [Blastococcus litoris]